MTAKIWDVRRLTQPPRQLERDVCNRLLGPYGRRFARAAIDADPLLRAEWGEAGRDVCAGVAGVAPLAPAAAAR